MNVEELNIVLTADTGSATQNINITADAFDDMGKKAENADSGISDLVKALTDAASRMMSVTDNIAQSAANFTTFQNGIEGVASVLTGVNLKFDILTSSIQQSYLAFDGAAQSVNNLASASEASASSLNSIVSSTDGFSDRMERLQTNTQGTSDSMASLQKELTDALVSIRDFSGNMGNAGRDAEEAAAKIKELSEQVKALPTQQPIALAAGFKKLKGVIATLGIAKFAKDSHNAYVTQMQNELKLTAHMKQRMNATNEEVQSIKDLAAAQQKIGIIGDEIQLAGAQQLTTYAKQTSTLKTLLPAMNNLIAQNAGYEASVGNATSAADMLGRALNGQYTSLKRMGVTFTAAQEQILKYGNEQQKAAALADAINSKVGNMNELLAQTPTGQLKQLENEFGDLQEEIGATFEPLIRSIVPIIRAVLETLREPILNISRGFGIIGQALAALDSPAVRAIALTAAGFAALYKLKSMIGATSAGLLVLSLAVAYFTGKFNEQQDNIGAIVEDAYGNVANALGDAADGASELNEEATKTEKTLNRLAGFDTITKLSGSNSMGKLTEALLGSGGLGALADAKAAIEDISGGIENLPAPSLDMVTIKSQIGEIGDLLQKAFAGTGDEQYEALKTLDNKLEETLGDLYTDVLRPTGDKIGEGLYHLDESVKNAVNGDFTSATEQFVIAESKFAQLNPFMPEEQRAAANRLEADVVNNSAQFQYDLDKSMIKPQEDALKTATNVMNGIRDNQIDILNTILGEGIDISWMHDWNKGVDNFYAAVGNFVYNTQNGAALSKRADMESYSVQDFNYAIIDELKRGMSVDEAITNAKQNFITTDDMQRWFDEYVNVDRITVAQWQENLRASGQIQTTGGDYRSVPTSTGMIPTSVMNNEQARKQIINVYVDGVEKDATVDNGGYR